MRSGKAAGPSGIIIEMIKASGDEAIVCLTSVFNHIMFLGRALDDYHLSCIISLFKKKRDALLVETTEILNCRNM